MPDLLRKLILAAACLTASALLGSALAAEPFGGRVGVLISGNIRPYMEAAEGVADTLRQARNVDVSTYSLDKYPEDNLSDLSRLTGAQHVDLVVAIGPRAARLAWSPGGGRKDRRLYAMVLNPQRVIEAVEGLCGIPLNIPLEDQLQAIRSGLPGIRRLGLLVDPTHNAELLAEAVAAAESLGLSIVPLKVFSKPDIPAVLETYRGRMDALWFVPDRTVISESIVEYVIREAIYQKMPVIGYNRFFYDSGASLAFVIDYREVGAQCAREAMRMMDGGGCRQVAPVFQLWVNTRVMGKLGVAGPSAFSGYLREGP